MEMIGGMQVGFEVLGVVYDGCWRAGRALPSPSFLYGARSDTYSERAGLWKSL